MKKLLLLMALAPTLIIAQSKKQKKAIAEQQKVNQGVINNLKAHVLYLSHDRPAHAANSSGEGVDMEYISNQFKAMGLLPKGTNGYFQPFNVSEGRQIDTSTFLSLDGKKLTLNKDFTPFAFSATKSLKGMPAMALRERGAPWFFDVKDLMEANSANASFNVSAAIRKEAARAIARGATGLFVYNSSNAVNTILADIKDTAQPLNIPVVYIMPDGYKKYFADHSQLLDIEMNIAFKEKVLNGNNVLGYIDNGAPTTVVIGAHYDHLGKEIGNVVDTGSSVNSPGDNASSTAMLIELARILKSSKAKTNNYLFIAFSGKEDATLGSKYWLDKPTIPSPVNYMIDLSMVGRYDPSKKLSISGLGNSILWQQAVSTINDQTVELNLDNSIETVGDKLAFYQRHIPMLFVNNDNRSNGNQAADEINNINYDGMLHTTRYLSRIVEFIDGKGRLTFVSAQ